MTTDKKAKIAALNDLFRIGTNLRLGQAFMTPGISSLPMLDQFYTAGHSARPALAGQNASAQTSPAPTARRSGEGLGKTMKLD